MKISFLLLLCLLHCSLCLAQYTYNDALMVMPIDTTDWTITYEGVVEVPGVPTDKLFNRARSFFYDTFKSTKAVLDIDDRASGVIAGKGLIPLTQEAINIAPRSVQAQMYDARYRIPIEIKVKDGRYKYRISSISTIVGQSEIAMNTSIRGGVANRKVRYQTLTQEQFNASISFDRLIKGIVKSLEKQMKEPADKDDW